MNQIFSFDRVLSFLNACEDELDNSLNQTQLEILCSSIIEKFVLYIEEHEFIKQQYDLKIKTQDEHILYQKQQIQNYYALMKVLQEQIQTCLAFTEQIKTQVCSEDKIQLDISKIESLLISKLAQQNQQCLNQIETLSCLIQENYQTLQQIIIKNRILKSQLKLLTANSGEYELKIQLPHSYTINQIDQSRNDSILEEFDSCLNQIEDQLNSIQQNSENSHFLSEINYSSNHNSKNKISTQNLQITDQSRILKETQSIKLKLKEKRILKENKQIISQIQKTSVPSINPYEIFFKLIVQCVKLDIGKSEAFNLNFDQYYQIFQSECIPFNEWYQRIKKLIQYKLKIQQFIK